LVASLYLGGGTVTFKYDPFGRRIYKSSSSGTSVYAYDWNNLIEETNSSGAAVARYLQALNIDEPLAMLRSHGSIRITERHYAPWTRSRQEQIEADLKAAWSNDPLVLTDGKGIPELQGKTGQINRMLCKRPSPGILPCTENLDCYLLFQMDETSESRRPITAPTSENPVSGLRRTLVLPKSWFRRIAVMPDLAVRSIFPETLRIFRRLCIARTEYPKA
jgi:hypothetical protein